MADQFVVPQFLDVESKIIGPITGRQFLILMATAVMEFVVYSIFRSLFLVLAVGVPIFILALVFAFMKVNGKPFHFLLLNMVQTFRRPMLRVWDKTPATADLKARLKKEEVQVDPIIRSKPTVSSSRLSEMSLVVNTGGVYQPDELEKYGKEK